MATLQTIEQRLVDELGIGMTIPTIDSLTVTTVVNTRYLRNSNYGGNQFLNWGIWRPDTATAADNFRFAGTLTNSTGTLAHTGANYTDTTATSETLILLKPDIDPDGDINPAINRALERIYDHVWEPLSWAPDAAMRETNFASWGTLSNATAAKQTTASRVFPGFIRSAAITNTGVNGYQPTANIAVTPGEPLLVGALSRVNSGTAAQLTLFNVTGSATFGTAITHSESSYQYMWQIVAAPSGCRNINVRLGGTGAADVTDWQALWVYRMNNSNIFPLPSSYMDEMYKLESLAYIDFQMGTASGVFQAFSMQTREIPRSHYTPDFMAPAANPSFIQFSTNAWFGYPLMMQMRLPYSERGVLTAEADVTSAPLHLVLAAAKLELLMSCEGAAKGSRISLQQAKKEFDDAVRNRATSGPAQRNPAKSLIGLRN